MAWIDRASDSFSDRIVVDDEAPTFAAGHVLLIVAAEGTDMIDRPKLPILVGSTDALARILDYDKAMALGDGQVRIHVAGSPHIWTGIVAMAGPLAASTTQGSMVIVSWMPMVPTARTEN